MSKVVSPLAQKIGAFVTLRQDELVCLSELQSHPRSISAHTEIVSDGQAEHRVWILLDGWADCYKLLSNGGRQIIGFSLPGDFLGLRSVLLRCSDHSCECLTDSVVSEIPLQSIVDVFRSFPRLATAILWAVARDDAMVVEHLVSIGRRSAIERTAHFFLEMGQRLALIGQASDNGFACPLNQYVLADALGLSAIHVNRVLRQLRERELMTLKAHRVIILDPVGLKDLSGFDGAYLNHDHASGT